MIQELCCLQGNRLRWSFAVEVAGTQRGECWWINCTLEPSCLRIICLNWQDSINTLIPSYFNFWLRSCLTNLLHISHPRVLIFSSNNAKLWKTMFTDWLSVRLGFLSHFMPLLNVLFCPCQWSSIDDQDNYKPVNHQLTHETHLRNYRIPPHEYLTCISVTMLKLLCTNITRVNCFDTGLSFL